MSDKPIEVILMRLLASYLAMPVLVVNTEGALLFFNEAAEAFLGMRFDETGELPANIWSDVFAASDCAGVPLSAKELPPMVALAGSQPAHRTLWVRGREGKQRHVEVLAFPLIGHEDRHIGAVALLWERPA
jgi:PAS domain-containing protein